MKKNFLFFGIAFLVVVIDQLTKFAVTSALSFSESIAIINNFFYFTLIKNFGIGFGLLNNPSSRWIFILTTIIIIGIVLYYYKSLPKKYLPVVSTSLILGGAIGNLIDRFLFGFVIDFIDFRFWPAFNIADSGVTIGVIGLIIYFWQTKK
ncbi:signal peptidase II [Candidatus Woesearchaeota archaeon]|nr:signal peptidase II [Candidatus Woesearchaeota archaeon]